jgi:lipopolysaccharide export LptBFGC system permease protein LptF
MRNLVLILLAFIAVVTFIRAFDNAGSAADGRIPEPVIEFTVNQ